MVTQDVKGLPVGMAAYTALLTAKGGMVADARILHRPEDLLLDVEPGRGPVVQEFLERYLVSEEVEIARVSDGWAIFGLRGPKSVGVLGALGNGFNDLAPYATRRLELFGETIWAIGAGLWTPEGVDLLVPAADAARVFEALEATGKPLGLRLAGMQAAEWLRVESGLPRYGADIEERTLPLEANLEGAIHYQKGCYIGQEVVARATYRGHMNRKLAGLLLGTAQASPKTELKQGERKAGWVTTVVPSPALGQNVALGYVHRDFLQPGTQLTLGTGGPTVTVSALPLTGSKSA